MILEIKWSSFCELNLKVPGGSDSKEPACTAEDPGWIPGWGISPGRGNGNPVQYSCLGNPMDRGAWRAIIYGFTRVRHCWVTKPPPCLILLQGGNGLYWGKKHLERIMCFNSVMENSCRVANDDVSRPATMAKWKGSLPCARLSGLPLFSVNWGRQLYQTNPELDLGLRDLVWELELLNHFH